MSLVLGLWVLPEEIRTNCCYGEQLPLPGEGPLLGGSDRTWEGACPFCLVQPPHCPLPRRPPSAGLSPPAARDSAGLTAEKHSFAGSRPEGRKAVWAVGLELREPAHAWPSGSSGLEPRH